MSTAVRTVYIEFRATAARLQQEMAGVEAQVDRAGKSGKQAGAQISAGMDKAHESFSHVVGSAAEAALAIEGLVKGISKYSMIAAASGSTTDGLVNTYRALRIALSPTPFTVVGIAAGFAAEETLKLVNARAKLIEQQALVAAIKGRSVAGVEAIHSVATVSGANEDVIQGLIDAVGAARKAQTQGFNNGLSSIGFTPEGFDASSWQNALGGIARGFDSIADPAERARVAVQLFGKEHAAEALEELTPAFANAATAAGQFGYTLNATARQQIDAFRRDMLDLKASLLDFSKERTWVEALKTQTAEVTAAYYDMAKSGISAIARLIDKQTGIAAFNKYRAEVAAKEKLGDQRPDPREARLEAEKKRAGLTDSDLPDDKSDLDLGVGPGESARKESVDIGNHADSLIALARGAAVRRAQTFTGRIQALKDAQDKADTAYATLVEDQQKRHEKPNDPALLTGSKRFGLIVSQQSSAAVAAGLTDEIRGVRQAPAIAGNDIEENRRDFDAKRQDTESDINLARLSAQSQIDALRDVHERAVAEANADLATAQDRSARLTKIYTDELITRIGLIRKRAAAQAVMEGSDDTGTANITAQNEIRAVRAETSAKLIELSDTETAARLRAGNTLVAAERGWGEEITASWDRAYDKVQKKARDTFIEQNAPGAYRALASQQVGEIESRGKGALDDLAIQRQKLELERSSGAESTRTRAEQINFMAQMARLQDDANTAKLTALAIELQEVEVYAKSVAGSEKEIEADRKVADLKQQIARLSGESTNAQYEAQTRIQQAIQAPKWASYFARLRAEAKDSAQIMQESMTSAIDDIAGGLADLSTGKKANWGQMLQNIGNQMAKESIKSIMQRGLSSVFGGRDPATGAQRGIFGGGSQGGGVFSLSPGRTAGNIPGIGPMAAGGFGKPDGTPTNPYYVVLVAQQAQQQAQKPSFWGTVLGSFLGALTGATIGGIGGGGGSSVSSSVSYPGEEVSSSVSYPGEEVSSSIDYGDIAPRARGGNVSPADAYLVGEEGPEILTGTAGRIHSNSDSRKMLGGDTHNYYIDAAPGVSREEMVQAVTAAHRASVSTSVQANVEFKKRRPGN